MIYSNPIVLTVLTSVLPIAERGAVSLGIGLGLSPLATYCLVLVGTMLPVLPVLFFLRYASKWAMEHVPIIRRILEWVFARTRTKYGHRFDKIGFWALVALVAIPLPVTGVWTASAVAYLIEMPIKKAFFAILIGAAIATFLLLAGTLGFIKLL